ncbi:Choline-sulfatase [Minicystis rosea]|nr:Choline-sulfatase [Minicystis rosea]
MLRRLTILPALLLVACGNTADPRRDLPKPATAASASASAAPSAPPPHVLLDMVQALPRCDVDHRGPLFDVGSEALAGRHGWARTAPAGLTPVEHDGATWGRFTDRKFQLSFTLLEPTPIFVSARAVSYGAKNIAVTLDDAPLGTLVLAREQIKIAQTGTTTLPVDPGLHTLTFRFYGRVRDGDAFADIDWIRVGIPDESTVTYGPPTLRDTVAPAAALSGVPHRSIALRAPGSVRCALRFPRGARLRTAVGLQGAGEGDAEIRVLRDGKKPEVIRTVHLEGGEKAAWVDVDLPLAPFDGMVGALELRAIEAPRGGRVLFGDPAVVLAKGAASPPPPARAVIVVVLDGVTRAELPPWSTASVTTLPTFAALAQSATVFDQHRAPSTVVAASMASLLTGLPPQGHGVTDTGARLPAGVNTIAGVARDASVRTAMFSGVPYTFRAFGFGGAWERYTEHPPSSGAAATAPIDDALAWITETGKNAPEARLLAVVHARGGHPPWDVSSKELSTAGPPEYTGLIEPRSAAQKIARLRRSKRQVVTEADRLRIRALEQLALAGQDRALGVLLTALHTSGLWDSTLLIVTGDVSSGSDALFADGTDLKEPALTLPLYAHFPGGVGAGRRLSDPTEMVDIARTALAALALPPPKQALGRDLARIVLDLDVASLDPQVATLDDRYAARWGDLVLSGKFPKAPSLCDLSLDATCAFNRRDVMPIAASAIFRWVTAQDLATRSIAAKREPATIDGDTSAALNVWGATE